MSNEVITETRVTGKEVADVLQAMSPVLEKFNENVAGIACLSMFILLQKPDIKIEDLVTLVKGTSDYVATCLTEGNGEVH